MTEEQTIATGEAKCQAIGINADGSQKLMIYLPKSVIKFLDLRKGNLLGFQLFVQDRSIPNQFRSMNAKKNILGLTEEEIRNRPSELPPVKEDSEAVKMFNKRENENTHI